MVATVAIVLKANARQPSALLAMFFSGRRRKFRERSHSWSRDFISTVLRFRSAASHENGFHHQVICDGIHYDTLHSKGFARSPQACRSGIGGRWGGATWCDSGKPGKEKIYGQSRETKKNWGAVQLPATTDLLLASHSFPGAKRWKRLNK